MAQPNQARPACLTCLEPASGIRTFPTLDFGVPDPSLKLGWAEAGNAKRLQLPSEASPLCHHSRTNRFPLEMLAAGSLAGPNVAFVAATATAMLENWADLCSNSRLAAFAGIVGKIAWRAAKCPLAQWHLFYFSSSLGRIAFKLSRPLLGVLFPRAISKNFVRGSKLTS